MKTNRWIAAGIILVALIAAGFWYQSAFAPEAVPSGESQKMTQSEDRETPKTEKNPVATLETSKGAIEIELFRDKTPITVENFVKLAKSGFYDKTKFHRVIPDFMIQAGDPNSKGADTSQYGFGGPGYTIADEFVAGVSNVRGTIAMANTGQQNSGGSQFFINLVDNTGLDFDKPPFASRHPVFGKVIEGMDVVDAIAKVKTGANDIPVISVVITRVTIEE